MYLSLQACTQSCLVFSACYEIRIVEKALQQLDLEERKICEKLINISTSPS